MADGLLITDVAGEWEVWCGADGENIINAHLIGRGDTKTAAVADAIAETETLLLRLRAQAEPSDRTRRFQAAQLATKHDRRCTATDDGQPAAASKRQCVLVEHHDSAINATPHLFKRDDRTPVCAGVTIDGATHESDDPRGPWWPIKDGQITKRYVCRQVTP